MSRTRIGIIGAGNMGRAHARAYRENARGCELAAVADIDRDRARAFPDEFGIEAAVLDAPSVAVVRRSRPDRHWKVIAQIPPEGIACLPVQQLRVDARFNEARAP